MPKMTVAQKREFLVEMCNCREYLKTDVELNKAVLKKHLKFLPQQKLYKFRVCIEREFRMLEENCIWMSLASSFPDPFDHTINIDLVKNRREVKEWLGKNGSSLCFEVVKRLFEEKGLAIPYTFSDFEDYMKTCLDENGIPIKDRERAFLAAHATPDELSQMDSIIQQLVCAKKRFAGIEEQMTKMLFEIIDQVRRETREKSLIYCMTERYDNHTLWENYAQNYTGFCIEYCFRDLDGREFDDYESLVYMLPITYRKEKPYFDIVRFMDGAYRQFIYKDASWQRDPELDADLNMQLLYKNSDYAYEHEWRFSIKAENPNKQRFPFIFFRGFDFAQQKEAKNLLKHPDRVLRETFRAAMAICGCDEEEVRYLYGSAPESVFARNYCAYDDPRELAKLAAVVEHYIFSLMSASDTALDFKINRSGEDYAIAAAPGSRISGDLTVDLSKISHDNLEAGRDLIIEFKSSDSVFVTTELDLEEN